MKTQKLSKSVRAIKEKDNYEHFKQCEKEILSSNLPMAILLNKLHQNYRSHNL